MDAFAALIEELDQSTGTKRKIDLIAGHLQRADAHDAAWTVLLPVSYTHLTLPTIE